MFLAVTLVTRSTQPPTVYVTWGTTSSGVTTTSATSISRYVGQVGVALWSCDVDGRRESGGT